MFNYGNGVSCLLRNLFYYFYWRRPLFFYVKKGHVSSIPGIEEFIAEIVSDKAIGPEGYLVDKGLIALPDAERKKVADNVKEMKLFTTK